MKEVIYLRVGDRDRISLSDFVDSLKDFMFVLKDLDAAISKSRYGSMKWEVVSLQKNSPPVIGVTSVLKRGHFDIAEMVESEFIKNASLLSSRGERTDQMSDSALKKIESLAGRTRRVGPINISLNGNGPIRASADITEVTFAKVKQLTGIKYSSFGSIYGSLDSISVHSGNEFRVWNERTKKPIRCRFDGKEMENVKAYLGERVMVAGIVKSNAVGNPVSINVEDLELAPKDNLPSIEEMSGFIKDFTGGYSLKEYMERLSNE